MALTSAQIVTLACSTAKCPNFTSQGGQLLNAILQDLCQTYDFALARGTFTFNFNTSALTSTEFPNIAAGCGPYSLPSDFLRFLKDEAVWYLNGVPYPMIAIDISEYDWQIQQAGNQSFPYLFATDVSRSPPLLVVWPGASGAFQCMTRYQSQMPDIGSGVTAATGWVSGSTAPESSSIVPWFPNQTYLLKELSGRLMELTDDDRAQTFRGDGDGNNPGAQAILRKFLMLANDDSNRAKRVTLDRRRFGAGWSTLPSTKSIGWP